MRYWRSLLIACLATILLTAVGKRLTIGAGAPHQIGSGLDTMVLVPAGWFIMGSNEGDNDEKPQRRVYLDAFYIDKYPVTNARFRRLGEVLDRRCAFVTPAE